MIFHTSPKVRKTGPVEPGQCDITQSWGNSYLFAKAKVIKPTPDKTVEISKLPDIADFE